MATDKAVGSPTVRQRRPRPLLRHLRRRAVATKSGCGAFKGCSSRAWSRTMSTQAKRQEIHCGTYGGAEALVAIGAAGNLDDGQRCT